MKTGILPALAFTFFLILSSAGVSAVTEERVDAIKVLRLDPVPGRFEESWDAVPEYGINIPGSVSGGSLKIFTTPDRIYLRIRYHDPDESRKHRLWHWDDKRKLYIPGGETEDTLSVIWVEQGVQGRLAGDLWIWRAARTDPSGRADDLYFYITGAGIAPVLNFDRGLCSWTSRYFSFYSGDAIPRFYSREASGSASDVSASGRWEEGFWTVTFSRKIVTGNSDDLEFRAGRVFFLKIVSAPPDKFVSEERDFYTVQIEAAGKKKGDK